MALALRFAARELRGGLRGFYVFIACIALGVMAIAGIGSVAAGLADGLAREGRVILGGDLAFSLSLREAGADERAFLDRRGRVSLAATLRAMARADDGRSALVEVKAVDAAYPLYGEVALDPPQPLAAVLAQRDGAFGAAADPALLARLDLKPGARIMVGAAAIEIRAALTSEPDKLAGGIGFGPRLLISEAALRATGLLQPGSVVRWHYRLRLPDNDATDTGVRAVTAAAQAQLPEAGWEVRSRSNASPALERNVERFTQYLTLVGLTALLVGGVGVANAVKGHLDRRRDAIATLKALGATGSRVFAIYLTQVLVLAALGALPGLAVGAALPFLIAWGFGAVLPLPIAPAVHPGELALALLYGLLTAAAFALWPLGRAHDVPVSALFRDEVASERHWPRRPYIVATALVGCALAGIAIALAYDRRIAAIFVAAALAVFVLLRLVAALLMLGARRLPRPRSPVVRLALANIHRPGAVTPSVVLSLGLGVAVLVTVIAIDGNLRRQFLAALPDKAPSFYFVDIPAAEADRFDAFVHARAPRATLERVPMLRGRIVAAKGVAAEDLKPSPDTTWALQSDRGITYGDEVPAGSRLIAGQWWTPDYQGPPLGVVGEAHRRRARPHARRPGHGERARPQPDRNRRQSAHGRLAEPRHQLRHGVLARHLPRRPAHPHRHTDVSRRRHERGGSGAAESDGGCLSGDHHRARTGGTGFHRPYRDEPHARDPRRERAHPGRGGAGAGRGARGRTPAPRLRRRHPEDRRCDPDAAAVGLCARISRARRRHRAVRRGGGLGGRRLDHHQGHEPVFRLAAGPLAGGGRRRHRRNGAARAGRHLHRARPEAGVRTPQPVISGERGSGPRASDNTPRLAANMPSPIGC